MKNRIFTFSALLIVGGLLVPQVSSAHCPLCTAGAGAAALLALYFGISSVSVGLMIGAFAVAMGLWFDRLIKRQIIPYQKWWLAGASFILTVWPLRIILSQYGSISLFWFGDYGSFFNRTYLVDHFVVGSLLGALVMVLSPYLSSAVSRWRQGKRWSWQGIILTFIVLLVLAAFIELVII
ncbi:hypothetical protein HY933_04060 [Candidatus Falkowbacteria bacterium]|nr:hypothetical protein [Candidatus Falkowbacteria bacterium]